MGWNTRTFVNWTISKWQSSRYFRACVQTKVEIFNGLQCQASSFWRDKLLDVFRWMAKKRIATCTHFDLVGRKSHTRSNWSNNISRNTKCRHWSRLIWRRHQKHDSWSMWLTQQQFTMHVWWEMHETIPTRLTSRDYYWKWWISSLSSTINWRWWQIHHFKSKKQWRWSR